ncbi:MAG: peptide synthetase [Firmicutes bacterium]|nr:peptide synthetase [Bacillota bacterium]
MEIRKIVTMVEEFHMEAGQKLEKPLRKAAAIAVFENPYAGKYVEDLTPLIEASLELGEMLTTKAVEVLGVSSLDEVESYGKGVIVGENGELEHAAALMHPKLGTPMRRCVGGGKALIPSAKKRGGVGTALDVPLGFKDAAFVRSHFDAMEVRVSDGPRANELALVVVVTNGGRPLPRIGGLKKEEIKGEDGLR